MNKTNSKFPLPAFAWLALLALSFIGLFLGELFGHARWVPLLVAVIIWAKGSLVARYFVESHQAHPYIAWIMRVFIAFVPVALVITAFLGK